ncbi:MULTISPECIES: hypothetical protein [unclassified Rhizobium]|uniref:hypothetical protein n=1 Tax=unclassified Rhizobium TaxID=2613769 RepID=UPI00288A9D36|nr:MULTISPECIES: hypothetical protein [unclassified Rhizobium]
MAKVTNISPGPRGLHTSAGLVFVDAHRVWEGEIDDAALKSAIDTGWFVKGEKKAPGEEGDSEEVVGLKTQLAERDQQIAELRTKLEAAEKAVSEAGNGNQTAALKAEHHGGGKFNVTQGEAVLLSGLSKAEADDFNAKSDEDKAAYVDASKK